MTKRKCDIFIKENYVVKNYKVNKSYLNEKNFYLNIKKYNLCFIPKLYAFNDTHKILIIQNVGQRINKNKVDWSVIRKYYDILSSLGYYHNDMRVPNILLNDNKFYIIDFEYTSNKFKEFKNNYNIYKLMGIDVNDSSSDIWSV